MDVLQLFATKMSFTSVSAVPHAPAAHRGPYLVLPNNAVIAQQHADRSRLVVVAWVVLALTALAAIPLGWFAAAPSRLG